MLLRARCIGVAAHLRPHDGDRALANERRPIVSTEMVMFEWMKRADVPEFRELLKIVKSV